MKPRNAGSDCQLLCRVPLGHRVSFLQTGRNTTTQVQAGLTTTTSSQKKLLGTNQHQRPQRHHQCQQHPLPLVGFHLTGQSTRIQPQARHTTTTNSQKKPLGKNQKQDQDQACHQHRRPQRHHRSQEHPLPLVGFRLTGQSTRIQRQARHTTTTNSQKKPHGTNQRQQPQRHHQCQRPLPLVGFHLTGQSTKIQPQARHTTTTNSQKKPLGKSQQQDQDRACHQHRRPQRHHRSQEHPLPLVGFRLTGQSTSIQPQARHTTTTNSQKKPLGTSQQQDTTDHATSTGGPKGTIGPRSTNCPWWASA